MDIEKCIFGIISGPSKEDIVKNLETAHNRNVKPELDFIINYFSQEIKQVESFECAILDTKSWRIENLSYADETDFALFLQGTVGINKKSQESSKKDDKIYVQYSFNAFYDTTSKEGTIIFQK